MVLGPDFWRREVNTMIEIVFPLVNDGAQAGVYEGFRALEVDVDVNWTLVNEQVRQWASQYTFTLVKGITDTTAALYQQKFSDWVETGAPLDDLIDAIAPMVGPVRAEMIAVTEVTRVYAEGNLLAWRTSGVVDEVLWMTAEDDLVCPICAPLNWRTQPVGRVQFGDHNGPPPAHVRCRCWLQPVVNTAALNLRLVEGKLVIPRLILPDEVAA